LKICRVGWHASTRGEKAHGGLTGDPIGRRPIGALRAPRGSTPSPNASPGCGGGFTQLAVAQPRTFPVRFRFPTDRRGAGIFKVAACDLKDRPWPPRATATRDPAHAHNGSNAPISISVASIGLRTAQRSAKCAFGKLGCGPRCPVFDEAERSRAVVAIHSVRAASAARALSFRSSSSSHCRSHTEQAHAVAR
jgi:hypothetical protein